jgi:hypothetical protein
MSHGGTPLRYADSNVMVGTIAGNRDGQDLFLTFR